MDNRPKVGPFGSKHLLPKVPWLALALAVCLGAVLAGSLWRSHRQAEAGARLIATTLGHTIEQHVSGRSRGIEALLGEVAAAVAAGHDRNAGFADLLGERMTAFPEILAIGVLEEGKEPLALAGALIAPPEQLAWLRRHSSRGGAPALWPPRPASPGPGGPVQGRPPRWGHGGGPDRRMVLTLLRAATLATFLDSVLVGETASLAVVHRDGQVVAVAPGQTASFALPAAALDSEGMIVVALDDALPDLTVRVAMSASTAFRVWQANATLEIALFVLFCLAMALWAWRGERARRHLTRDRDGLEALVEQRGAQLSEARRLLETRARRTIAANRELQRLSLVAAHHLQEPLRPLVSYAQMLARRLDDPGSSAHRRLERLIGGGKDLKRLLRAFQQRISALAEAGLAEVMPLDQVLVRAAADARTRAAVRMRAIPALAIPGLAVGEVLKQVLRGLDELGASAIVVEAQAGAAGASLRIAPQPLLADGESLARSARICIAMANLNGMELRQDQGGYVLDLGAAQPSPEPAAVAVAGGGFFAARLQAVALVVAMALATVWQFRLERDGAIHAAGILTRAVANSIDQQISGSLHGIDTVLAETADAVAQGTDGSKVFAVRMEAAMRAFPELRLVGRADLHGRVAAGGWPDDSVAAVGADISGRLYFRRAAALSGPAGLAVGEPLGGAGGSERSFPVARPVRDHDGRFAGIVFALVDPDHYADFLDKVLLDEQGGTALIGRDGRMIARAPGHREKFGMDISSSDLFIQWLPRAPAGIAHLISKADGNDKYLAYRLLSPYPLVVTSGISRHRVLESWRRGAWAYAIAAAILAVALLALAWMMDSAQAAVRREHALLSAEVRRRTEGLEQARAQSDARAAALQALNGQLRELLGVPTRDLREPVRVLMADTEAVRAELAGREGQFGTELAFIAQANIRLSALLRDFSRFVSVVGATCQPTDIDLRALVDLAAVEMERRFGRGVLALRCTAPPTIHADGAMILELLCQLFANAIAYRHRAEAVRVEVSAYRQDDADCLLRVSDDGPGLSAEQLSHDPQAFDMNPGQAADSTGIGLAICRVIAQAHGGTLWLGADSTLGGAQISVLLPQTA